MAHGLPTSELEVYWMSIEDYHLNYLNAEESPKKIAEKKKLESIIRSFLMRIPHNKKFLIPPTAQIFRKSVEEVKNFSIVKLSNAWTVIGLYAQNLISQPWRKEFHKIRMFSGYYEHNVRDILVDGEQMLMFMGYEHIGDGVMYLDGPVDPHRVALVSKDCFIASAECQVMFQIYSEIIGRSNNVPYDIIYNFREQNICDTTKAVLELSSRHQRPHSMYSTMGLPFGACSRTLAHTSRGMNELVNPHQHWHREDYGLDGAYYNSNSTPHHLSPNYGYAPNLYSYFPPPGPYHQNLPPVHHNSVPTGQLIEFGSPQTKSYLHDRGHRRNGSEPLKHDRMIEDEPDFNHSEEIVKNWLNHDKMEREELSRDQCEEMANLKLSDPLMQDSKGTKKKEKKAGRASQFYSRAPRSDQLSCPRPVQKPSKSSSSSTKIPDGNKWECLACTFHNKLTNDVCEMCDKSRVQGNESIPLVSGGRTCDKCTLVNELGQQRCKVCGESLQSSPTYI